MLPLLYLHGLSSGDFGPALEQFLGSGAGLSAATITRLTTQWQDEANAFGKRPPTGTDYVYCWVDGIHFKVRLEQDKVCLLVMIGVRSSEVRSTPAARPGEHDPLDRLPVQAPAGRDPTDRRPDPEPFPESVQRPRPAERAGVHDLDLGAACRAAVACSGIKNREIEDTSRARASRSTFSAWPKLWITFATELPVSGCRSLCVSWR